MMDSVAKDPHFLTEVCFDMAAPIPRQERTVGFYRQVLTKHLSPEVFKPNSGRLIWFGSYVTITLLSLFIIVQLNPIWPVKLLLGLLAGFANGSLGFLTHEISHGSVVKNRRLQTILCFIGKTPHLISPTYWKFAHNRLHHGKTQRLVEDPDAFPNLRLFKHSKFLTRMYKFTPGSGHRRSLIYFFFWFSLHNFMAQFSGRFKQKAFNTLDHKRVNREFGAQIAIYLAFVIYATYVNPANLLFAVIIPFMIQNYVLMSYISTNHNLSPLTSTNDPLANSLSVSHHPILEFLNFNFGYHVEHHIFPNVSGKHAKKIHEALVAQFPAEYKFMSKREAVKALYSTPRIYKNANLLIHPHSLDTHPTI